MSIGDQSSSAGREWMGGLVMALNVTGNAFRVTSNTIDRLHQKRVDGKYSGKVNFKRIRKLLNLKCFCRYEKSIFIRNKVDSQ